MSAVIAGFRSVKSHVGKVLAPLTAVTLLLAAPAASAVPFVWQETNNLQSTLDSNYNYSSDATTLTGVVSFKDQTATNVGASTEHMGMYLGWAWSYDSKGDSTPLLWNNGSNAFVGGPVSLSIKRTGFADNSLLLGSVVDDTWIGNPWSIAPDLAIATEANWLVPFFDFGVIEAGASVLYDIELTFSFDNASAFADWNQGGSFYVGGVGVQTVPDAGSSLALVTLALAGLALVRRRCAQ
jgi:VPDSG-CTERM motif